MKKQGWYLLATLLVLLISTVWSVAVLTPPQHRRPMGERSEMKKSDSEFINHLNETSVMVGQWPEWKQNVLKLVDALTNVQLALRLNKIVHDLCKDVPHDIGIKLAEEVTAFRMDSDRMDSTMYRIKTGDHYLKDF